MLCYWILRRPDGSSAGLVRVRNGHVTLSPTVPLDGRFTLFSGDAAVPIVPGNETVLPGAEAVLGTDGTRVTCFAAAESAAPLAEYRKRMSRFCTMQVSEPAAAAPSPQASAVPDPTSSAREEIPASPAPPAQEQARQVHVHVSNISHTDTDEADIKADSAGIPDHMPHNYTMFSGSISDSARETQAFSMLLRRAEAFYTAYEGDMSASGADGMVQKEDMYVEEHSGIDLFSQEYPGARWRYVDGAGLLPHYEGTWKQPNGQTLHILAVRGRAAPRPPRALLGFTRFLRDRDGTGYWLRLTPLS